MKLQLNIVDGISQELEIPSMEFPTTLNLNKADAMVLVLALTLAYKDEDYAAVKLEIANSTEREEELAVA
jgi:hypothetical protein